MGYRREGKKIHDQEVEWQAWKDANADLIRACGLPPGVLRSRKDWEYLLDKGYWCEHYFGAFISNLDFDLSELTEPQREAFRSLLQKSLSDQEKSRGNAAWHVVHPPRP